MLTFLVVSFFGLMALVFGSVVALPFLILASVFWLVLLPFKLLFKLIFGMGGMLLGMIVGPLVMLVVGVVLIGALVAGLLALLTPLLPIALLALFGWALYRLLSRRSGFPSSASGFRP